MLRLSIPLLEEFEEDLGAEKIGNTDELKWYAGKFKKHIDTIADVLDLLEKHGWTWTTGIRDIIIHKNTTKKDAEKEFLQLKIPPGLIEFD